MCWSRAFYCGQTRTGTAGGEGLITQKTHNQWKQLTCCHQTKIFCKEPSDAVGKFLLRQKKQSICVLINVITGHNALNKHLYQIGVTDSPMCDFCNKPESSFHFVAECDKYTSQRSQYLGSPKLTNQDFCDILNKGKDFLTFIKKSNRFNLYSFNQEKPKIPS